MGDLIVPEELPTWVPGKLTVCSPEDGWGDGVSVRGYRYAGSDVEIPAMRDYMVVAYRRGRTDMRRRVDQEWINESLGPGDVSLLTRAAESHWVWPSDVEVVHVYVTHDELAATCRAMYEREVEDVELNDEVKADDPAIHQTAMMLAAEADAGRPGSRIVVDSLSTQLAVHILRGHAHVLFREPSGPRTLTFRQERAVRDYVQEHLHENICLDELSGVAGLSRFHFSRCFKRQTGRTPSRFIREQRVAHAQTLLRRTAVPLAAVAQRCGFADQSHMTRVFVAELGVTPGRYRGAA